MEVLMAIFYFDTENEVRDIGEIYDAMYADDPRLLLFNITNFAINLDPPSNVLVEAILRNKHLMRDVPASAVAECLPLIVAGQNAVLVLDTFRELFAILIPELTGMFTCEQSTEWHCHNVWYHTLMAISHCNRLPPNVDEHTVKLALLFHDIGKPLCAETDDTGRVRFPKHAAASADIASSFLEKYGFEDKYLASVPALVRCHSTFFDESNFTHARLGKLIAKLSEGADSSEYLCRVVKRKPATIDGLLAVRKADILAQRPDKAGSRLAKLLRITRDIEKCSNLGGLSC